MKKIIYYKQEPGYQTDNAVRLLMKRPLMKGFDFIPLSEKEARRLQGKAVIYYGPGQNHWFSEWVDISLEDPVLEGQKNVVKINIDQHPDCNIIELYPGYDPECSTGGHFARTGFKENRELYLCIPIQSIGAWSNIIRDYVSQHRKGPLYVKWKKAVSGGYFPVAQEWNRKDNLFYLAHNGYKIGNIGVPVKRLEDLEGRKIQLTTDLDILREFPVHWRWITGTDCIRDDEYLALVNQLSRKDVVRFYTGGLWCPTLISEMCGGLRSIKDHEREELEKLLREGEFDGFLSVLEGRYNDILEEYRRQQEKAYYTRNSKPRFRLDKERKKTFNNTNYERAFSVLEESILSFEHLTASG